MRPSRRCWPNSSPGRQRPAAEAYLRLSLRSLRLVALGTLIGRRRRSCGGRLVATPYAPHASLGRRGGQRTPMAVTCRIVARRLSFTARHGGGERGAKPGPPTLTAPRAQVTSTWCTYGRQQPTRRGIIVTTNRQILLAVVLCVVVRRSDTSNAFLAGTGRETQRTPTQIRPSSLHASGHADATSRAIGGRAVAIRGSRKVPRSPSGGW